MLPRSKDWRLRKARGDICAKDGCARFGAYTNQIRFSGKSSFNGSMVAQLSKGRNNNIASSGFHTSFVDLHNASCLHINRYGASIIVKSVSLYNLFFSD